MSANNNQDSAPLAVSVPTDSNTSSPPRTGTREPVSPHATPQSSLRHRGGAQRHPNATPDTDGTTRGEDRHAPIGVSWDPNLDRNDLLFGQSVEVVPEQDLTLATSFANPVEVLAVEVDANGNVIIPTAARMTVNDMLAARMHSFSHGHHHHGDDQLSGSVRAQTRPGTADDGGSGGTPNNSFAGVPSSAMATHAQPPPGHHYLAIMPQPAVDADGNVQPLPGPAQIKHTLSVYPPEVIRIARQMRGLDPAQFLMLADLTQKRAWRNVYSLLEYRGSSWYLPTLRPIEAGVEKECGVGYDRTAGLWFSALGWRLEIHVIGYLVRISMLVAFWLLLWSLMPKQHMELKGFVFDPLVAIFFATITGGIISRVLRVPPLVCVLWMAILWANVPHFGYFTSGINKYVRSSAATLGLTLILIRAGLYIKPEELKPMLGPFLLFAFLPAIGELIAHSFTAGALFDYPDSTWAFAHGSVAAAVSPAIVVPAVLTLKLDGYGVTRGPGTFMMPAAPTEMVVAIWNINFMSQIAIDTGDVPLWLNILLGPLQIIVGALLGVVLGAIHYLVLKVLLAEAHKLPHRQYTGEHMSRVSTLSTLFLLILGAATNAYTKTVRVAGGGAIAVTVMAMTSSALMRRRSNTPYFAEQFKMMCTNTAELWDTIIMPVLFTMVGTGINLTKIFTADFFPKALACVVVGVAARMIVSLLVTIRQDYTVGERAVMAVGWCGKATVQAALGRTVLDRALEVYDTIANKKGVEVAKEYVERGEIITNTAVLLILILAPIASLVMVRVGPLVMSKEAPVAHTPKTEMHDDESPKHPTAKAADEPAPAGGNDNGDALASNTKKDG